MQIVTPEREVPSIRLLRKWARAARGRSGAITLRIVGAREGRRLNSKYRRRDYASNVLSFAYDDPRAASSRTLLRGDIILCHAVIAREAREQGKPLSAHYAHMVVHGMLHLNGMDHRKRSAAELMEAKEKRVLRALGVADPYAMSGSTRDRMRRRSNP